MAANKVAMSNAWKENIAIAGSSAITQFVFNGGTKHAEKNRMYEIGWFFFRALEPQLIYAGNLFSNICYISPCELGLGIITY